jgi:hypothetical protein
MIEPHVPALKLRRLFVGESLGSEQADIAAHAQSCSECRGRLRQLEEEQSRFFSTVSADRFAAGVERAVRVPRPTARPATTKSFFTVMSLGFVATCFALYLGAKPLLQGHPGQAGNHFNGIKGSAGISVRVAPAREGPQREASQAAPESLQPGERVRVGYEPDGHAFVFVFSIDDQGHVSTLYPEIGKSLPVIHGEGFRYFPDSLEFTGIGWERLIVALSDEPLSPEQVEQAASAALRQAGGELGKMGHVGLPGEQFHRLFHKVGGP